MLPKGVWMSSSPPAWSLKPAAQAEMHQSTLLLTTKSLQYSSKLHEHAHGLASLPPRLRRSSAPEQQCRVPEGRLREEKPMGNVALAPAQRVHDVLAHAEGLEVCHMRQPHVGLLLQLWT